jgi:Zn-dependent protease
MRGKGFRLGEVHGIEIRLDLSVAIIFFLVVYSLGAGLFPQWHADWSTGLSWATALAAAVLFFASLLAHELAHSLMAQRHGIAVPRITLFIFGGVSELEMEPRTPNTEFSIAIVGPLMSFALGLTFSALGLQLAHAGFLDDLQADPEAAMASLGPVATLLMWLGPVNLMLAIFNLVPGFPLDGGRVLRAALWWLGGDLRRATESASQVGRAFAWAIMAWGAWAALGGALVQGLWLLLIGWFLNNAARASYLQLLLAQAMESLEVADLMRTRFESIHAGDPLQDFIDNKLLRSDQVAWPVLEGGHPVGLIGLDSIRDRLKEEAQPRTVADAMGSIHESVSPHLRGSEALKLLLESRRDPIPVVDAGRLVGLLYHADLMRWLALHQIETRQKFEF